MNLTGHTSNRVFDLKRLIVALTFLIFMSIVSEAQPQEGQNTRGKNISSDLFGLFFEDINYSADGGLYAELVQNRSFEYSPTDHREWSSFSFWEYFTPGYSYGSLHVETSAPLNPNNPHYVVLDIEHVGHEEQHVGPTGVGIKNTGLILT